MSTEMVMVTGIKGGLARLDGEGILRLLDYKGRRLLAGIRGLGRNRNLVFPSILRRSCNRDLIILGINPRTSGVIHLNSRSQLLTRVSRSRYLYCANSLMKTVLLRFIEFTCRPLLRSRTPPGIINPKFPRLRPLLSLRPLLPLLPSRHLSVPHPPRHVRIACPGQHSRWHRPK